MENEDEEISRALEDAKLNQKKGERQENLAALLKALDVLHTHGWTAVYEEDADGCFWIDHVVKLG